MLVALTAAFISLPFVPANTLASLADAAPFLDTEDIAIIAPGSARSTEDLIAVDGAESYPSEGEVLFATVRIKTNPSVWDWLRAKGDDSSEIRDLDSLIGDRSVQENRDLNLQLMTSAKDTAVLVAMRQLGLPVTAHGALVVEVAEGTDAQSKLAPGDVIAMANGQPITFGNDLRDVTSGTRPGDTISLHIDPTADGAAPRDVDIVLSAAGDDPERAIVGIGIQDYNVEFPFDVTIDTGRIGGPSAGLAFTLAVLDVLTPGELTGGADVAVTGTIESDGSVGPIGGLPQKTAAVMRTGAEVFLVPVDETPEDIEAALDIAGDELRIVRVATVGDALAALAELGGNALALPPVAGAPPA